MDLKHFEELTQTAVWELDIETGYFHWSDRVFEMLGELPRAFQINQGTLQNRIFEDDRFRWQKALDLTLKGGPEINLDKRLLKSSGDIIWVNVRAKLHGSEEKKKLVGVYTDVNDEKQRQRNLHLLERVNANVEYAIVILETMHGKYHDSGIAYINQGFSKITGYAFSEAKGQALDILVENTKIRRKVLQGKEPVTIDCAMKTKQGAHCKIRWSFTPLEAEGLVLGLGLDITNQKSPEMLLEDAASAARIGSWEADFVTQKIYWSPTTYELHEMESGYIPDIKTANTFYHPDYRDRIAKMSENAVKKSKAFEYEAPIITAEGNSRWVKVMAMPKVKEGACIGLYGSIQDIHQRKVVELELQQSVKELEDYKFAMDQSAILAITDAKGVIIDVNQNFCKIAQYERDEIIGKTHRLINSGYHGSAFFREFWQTISSGKVWKGEIKNKAKDGSYYWVYTTVVPFLGASGKPIRYLAIRFDITSRKVADQNLLNTLREKNTILESIGDAFFAVDYNWVVTYWNKQAEKILGRNRSEIEGKVLWDVYADAVDTIFYTEYHKAVETGQQTSFEAYYEPLQLWLYVSAYPSEKGLSIYFRDISMRKKYEISLLESRERFQKVTQATNDAIWDWDLDKGEVFWGKGFKTLFGYRSGIRKVASKTWTSAIHPDDRENTVKSLETAIDNLKQKNYLAEYRFQKSDGAYAYVTDRSVIIRDTEGKAKRLVGAVSDITIRKEHEESLRKLNLQLERRAAELERSNAELEQFAFVASHDLQEPLRMITSFLQQLEKKYTSQLDDKAMQYIGFASSGAKRMKEIIADLLAFSRSGRFDSDLDEVNLNEVMNSYKLLRDQLIKEKKAEISYENLPVIKTTQAPLIQILHNILDNALKYCKSNVPPCINVSVKDENNYWLFAVADNGIGIRKEYFQKIFVIFQRLHNRDEYSGTGMGLAIVKKNIDQLGGEIWLESEVGVGTTFSFKIPK